MKRTLSVLSALFFSAVMIGAGRAQAQDLTATSPGDGTASAFSDSTTVTANARFVHDTDQGPSQNFNRRWDGARYDGAEIDAAAHTGYKQALLDLDLNDLRSTEESGYGEFSLGSSILLKGDFTRLTHRDGFLMNGLEVNNQFTPDAYEKYANGISTGATQMIKRDFQQEEVVLSLPGHPEYRAFAGQWEQHEYGQQALSINSTLYSQGYDNHTQQVYGGLDADIGKKGQAYFEHDFRKFVNTGQDMIPIIGTSWKEGGYQSNSDMTSDKLAFRYNPGKTLFFAGYIMERVRYNQFNGLSQYTYAGNLSGSYQPSKDFSFTTRLYGRGVQTTYRNQYQGTNSTPAGQDIDFLYLNGDFDARYTGIQNLLVAASYRPQVTTRSNTNQWSQVYPSTAMANGWSGGVNAPAGEDTRHNFSGSLGFSLPQNMELDLREDYTIANAAAYENTPTLSNVQTASLVVPFPKNVAWFGSLEDSNSKNTMSTFSQFTEKKDTLMTGLTWSDSKGRASLGMNYEYEKGVDSINAYWGATSGQAAPLPNGGAVTAVELAAPYNFTNHVLGVNGMIRPMQKLRVNADVSYTDSNAAFLTQQVFDQYNVGLTGSQAFNPTDLRILHWGVNANYQLCKFATARGGIRYDSWVDRINAVNDGRNTVYNLGVDMKF